MNRPVKELAEINNKGTPQGIVLHKADSMDEWIFLISVLGDETIYQVGDVACVSLGVDHPIGIYR